MGVRPRVDLAKAAGIDVNRGIVTNRLLETSAKNIYAMGDCAEVNGHVLHRTQLVNQRLMDILRGKGTEALDLYGQRGQTLSGGSSSLLISA